MTFSLADHWVWDFWIADDGDTFHLFYLHAPISLGDPQLRHRNAVIGHATSVDLRDWVDHGRAIGPGQVGSADETASWTGSVVRDDRHWWMFYTGSRFLATDRMTNIESIVAATSTDLDDWSTLPTILGADPEWYEVLADGTWHEEAWRDPWVVRDPDGSGWHMLITARARSGGAEARDRGIIGHAISKDLTEWQVLPPLSDPGSGFAHLEVIQWVEIDGTPAVIFSCDTPHLAGERAQSGGGGGIWAVEAPALGQHITLSKAARLTDDGLYAGRAVKARDGQWMLLGFENIGEHGDFVGRLSDPSPLRWGVDGQLRVDRVGAIR